VSLFGVTPGSHNFAQNSCASRYNAAMIDRRHLLSAGACALFGFAPNRANATGMSRITAYAFTFKGLDGGEIFLSSYSGHPILVVNTASLCGYTPQYAGLQTLWSRFRDKGLIVLGVPSNDFGGQEPGGVSDIHATAQGQYHVTFPITEKVTVKGKDAHPFYKWALAERPLEGPRWNFHKYLIGHDGYLKAGFSSAVEPTDPLVIAAIERELTAA
jgi:glutathione peroxidase